MTALKKRLIPKFWLYFFLLHFSLFFYSLAGVCSKFAAETLKQNHGHFLDLKFILFFGLLFMILVIYALMWQPILKVMPLTLAYASKAITIIWGIFWGVLLFREHISWNHIVGAVIIMIGIYFVNMREA